MIDTTNLVWHTEPKPGTNPIMFSIFYSILPIFLIVAIGGVLKGFFITEDAFWAGVEGITYYLLFPAFLVSRLTRVRLDVYMYHLILPLIIATLIIGFLLIGLQKPLGIDKGKFTSYFQGAVRYNTYLFIGISFALYGASSLPIVAIIIVYMIIVTNVFSVIVLRLYASAKTASGQVVLQKILMNPLVIACLISLLLHNQHFNYPKTLSAVLELLGDAALPVGLLCVGSVFCFSHLGKHFKPILLVTLLKLIILPALSLVLLYLFHVPGGLDKNIAVLYAALPCAGNAYILSVQMKGDHEAMAAIISATTLISLVTIPIVITIMAPMI